MEGEHAGRVNNHFSEGCRRIGKLVALTALFLAADWALQYAGDQLREHFGLETPNACKVVALVSYAIDAIAVALGVSVRKLLFPLAIALAATADLITKVDEVPATEQFLPSSVKPQEENFPAAGPGLGVQPIVQT